MNMELLPVDELELDMKNPRIARILEMYDPAEINAEQIGLALGAGDTQPGETYTTFRSLKESIRVNGGVIHPIIVNREPGGSLVVIEGNTRVQIYRDFKRDNVEGEWSKIPAVVHENLDEGRIEAIRLQAHLVGPRPWDPYSKARYLNYLRNSEHLTFNQIIEFCGGRRRQIDDYINAYRDMETHYRPKIEDTGGTFDTSRFSAFVELQQPRILNALINAGFAKEHFVQWVINEFFKPLQTIRQLPRILENNKAREVFLEDGAQEATKVLDVAPTDATLVEASLLQLAQEIARRIAHLELRDIQRLKNNPDGDEVGSMLEARSQLEELFVFITWDVHFYRNPEGQRTTRNQYAA